MYLLAFLQENSLNINNFPNFECYVCKKFCVGLLLCDNIMINEKLLFVFSLQFAIGTLMDDYLGECKFKIFSKRRILCYDKNCVLFHVTGLIH